MYQYSNSRIGLENFRQSAGMSIKESNHCGNRTSDSGKSLSAILLRPVADTQEENRRSDPQAVPALRIDLTVEGY